MKVISTAFRSQEVISWEDLEHFLNEGIYEEEFIVLDDDKLLNYIQMSEMEMENGYQWGVEMRMYEADNVHFKHFRSYFEAPTEAIPIFKAFYYDQPIDFHLPHWINITDSF